MKPIAIACAILLFTAAAIVHPTARADTPRVQAGQVPFRSGVELVEIPVIVRDRSGRFIADLKQDDFQILEQGVPQRITAFQRVSIPVVGPADVPTRTAAAVPADVSTNERLADSHIFVLVLDAFQVSPQRTLAVRNAAREFVEQHKGSADLVAVVSPGGLESATQDFTRDTARLLAAIDRFAGAKIRSAAVELEEERQAETRGGVMLHGGKDPSDHERANHAEALSAVLTALARHLDRAERRRTALLLFSEGIDYDTTDVTGTFQRYAGDVLRATNRAVAALMRANVSVYAIDPRGLSSAEDGLVESPLYRETPSIAVGPSPESELASSIRTLRDLSEKTGGFAVTNVNDFGGAFARIVEESSDYYVLGYTPVKALKPGEFRDVGVRVSRADVRVVARKGYGLPAAERQIAQLEPFTDTAPPTAVRTPRPRLTDSSPTDMPAPVHATRALANDVRGLLASPLPLAGLPMRVQAIPFAAEGRRGMVQIIIEVLGDGLRFGERGGRFEERIELATLTVDARGHAGNGRSTTLDLRLTPEELQRTKATGVRWLSRLELAPGRYQVRVAGRAALTGTMGLVTVDVDLPTLDADRPAMSGVTITSMTSLLMITKGDGRPSAVVGTPPTAARIFVAGDQLAALVEVSGPAAMQQDMNLMAHVEWPDGTRSHVSRKPVTAGQGRPRKEEIAFPVDTSMLPAGRYLLRLVLNSGGSLPSIERAVPFDVVSKASR